MKKYLLTSALVAVAGTASFAGGIDRSGQGIGAIFAETGESGSAVTLSFGSVTPTAANPTIGDPLSSYTQIGIAGKQQITDEFSLTLIYDQPFGADVVYDSGLPFFGGKAVIESDSITALGRYELGNGLSFHGGLRALRVNGEIFTIFNDLAPNPAFLEAESDWNINPVFGVAYERPDIALRVALTWSGSNNQEFTGTESTLGANGFGIPDPTAPTVFSVPTEFEIEFPESINLDVQTGVAPGTLVFGSIRHVYWGGFNLTTDGSGLPAVAGDAEYVSFDDDTTTYTLGVGRAINDDLSIAVSYTYEAAGDRPSTTALAPTTGLQSISIGGSYAIDDNVTLRGGVTYGVPGDQQVPSAAGLIEFADNDVFGIGASISVAF